MNNFTQKEFDIILKETIFELKMSKNPVNEKKAFLLGGQPGAGKSGLTSILQKENENIIVINGDDFRKKHPHYNEFQKTYGKKSVEYTKDFAGKMTEALINKLSDKGYSLIIEGTLRTAETPLKTQQELSKKGYQVELAVIQVKPEFSYLGTLTRYEEMINKGLKPRATLKKDHQIVVDNIANNLNTLYKQQIFSNIRIYNRENECLYSMKNTPNINPSTLILNEFKRDLTKDEKETLIKSYDKILNYMSSRGASEEEKSNILNLKSIQQEQSKENLWQKKLAMDKEKGLSLGR